MAVTPRTISDGIDLVTAALKRLQGFELPRRQAQLLLAEKTNIALEELGNHIGRLLTKREIEEISNFLETKPLPPVPIYLGYTVVLGTRIRVNRNVLLPGTETLFMLKVIEEQLKHKQAPVFVDIGTGSGVLAVVTALRVQDAKVYATDISKEALRVAEENIQLHFLQERVHLALGNWLEPLNNWALMGQVDVLAANPPYVCKDEIHRLPPNFLAYAPHLAIDGGQDGCDGYRSILSQAHVVLKQGTGNLILQTDVEMATRVAQLVSSTGHYDNISMLSGSGGINRIVTAVRNRHEHLELR